MKILKTIFFLACAIIFVCGFKTLPQCIGCKSIDVQENNGVYVFKIPAGSGHDIRTFVTESLSYNKDVFKETGAELVINAGYFDTKNQETTSYVVVDNNLALDPTLNDNLMNNKDLQPYMKQILNRTEFRVLACGDEIKYDISSHNARVPYKCKIKHSVQAGPLVYPDLRLKREYFVVTKGNDVLRDSIQALQRRPRTVVGIKDNDVYFVVATTKHPLSLIEIQDICADLKLDKAMNLDGGGSTSVDFKGTNNSIFENLHIVSEKNNTARKLKSFILVD